MIRQKTGDILGGLFSVMFGFYVLAASSSFPARAAAFPKVIAGLFVISGTILTVKSIRRESSGELILKDIVLSNIAVIFLLWLFAIIGISVLGFLNSIALFMMITCWFLKDRSFKPKGIIIATLFGVIITLIYWFIFCRVIELELPVGLFFQS